MWFSEPSPAPGAGTRPARRSPAPPRRLLAAGLALALLGGCAAPGPAPTPGGPRAAWDGRFAATWVQAAGPSARNAAPPREESVSGRFALRANGSTTELDVFTPLGQTIARAVSSPERATLETSDGSHYRADSAEALTEQVFGWRVPVAQLPRWLRGEFGAPRPAGAPLPMRTVDAGWEIVVDAWDSQAPRQMTLRWPPPATPATPATPGTAQRVTIRVLVDDPAQ